MLNRFDAVGARLAPEAGFEVAMVAAVARHAAAAAADDDGGDAIWVCLHGSERHARGSELAVADDAVKGKIGSRCSVFS